jgi:hypothetical protein
MISRIIKYFWPGKIGTIAEFQDFVFAEALHIAQKVPIDYCEARTNIFSAQLFQEREFLDALQYCIRESFIAVLGDLLVVSEGQLRPVDPKRAAALAERIGGLFGDAMTRPGGPVADRERAAEAEAKFRLRYGAFRHAPPRTAADIALASGQRMFETLPLHRRFTRQDQDAIVATVQYRMTIFRDTLAKRIDASSVLEEFLGMNSGRRDRGE